MAEAKAYMDVFTAVLKRVCQTPATSITLPRGRVGGVKPSGADTGGDGCECLVKISTRVLAFYYYTCIFFHYHYIERMNLPQRHSCISLSQSAVASLRLLLLPC